MRPKKFSGAEIQKILEEADLGASVSEISKRYGISRATFYHWRNGPKTEAFADRSLERLVKELSATNKKLLSENIMLRNSLTISRRGKTELGKQVDHLRMTGMSVDAACHVVGMSRATYYKTRTPHQGAFLSSNIEPPPK